ncbi:MAG: hypothetical protein IPK37_03940 [Austwickia sp.]|jgi:hypothetical protein|nr:MAG: hypothetical protein IPK37_03940 [Austwickia sp.]
MLEEGLTYIDESERLRLQAAVDRRRLDDRRTRSHEYPPGSTVERARPTRTPAKVSAPV